MHSFNSLMYSDAIATLSRHYFLATIIYIFPISYGSVYISDNSAILLCELSIMDSSWLMAFFCHVESFVIGVADNVYHGGPTPYSENVIAGGVFVPCMQEYYSRWHDRVQ